MEIVDRFFDPLQRRLAITTLVCGTKLVPYAKVELMIGALMAQIQIVRLRVQ